MNTKYSEVLTTPFVSVIVPIYNMEECLCRCVESILEQNFKDIEIILVDDGSTDGSLQVCNQYAGKYQNVIVLSKDNSGLSSARLAGFELARGNYILFVDSDDYIHQDMIRLLVDSIETNKSDMAICGYFEKRSDSKVEKIPQFCCDIIQGRKNIVDLYIKPLIGCDNSKERFPGFLCTRLMKRELIQSSYFQSERKFFMEDHVFDLLYADCIQSISVVKAPLYYYCVNRDSLTNRYRENKWNMLENLYGFYTSYIEGRMIDNCEKNLNSFLVFAFCISVDNAVLSGSYNCYIKEMKRISKSHLIKQIKTIQLPSQCPNTYRVTLMFYRLNLFLPLYFIRRARIRRNMIG